MTLNLYADGVALTYPRVAGKYRKKAPGGFAVSTHSGSVMVDGAVLLTNESVMKAEAIAQALRLVSTLEAEAFVIHSNCQALVEYLNGNWKRPGYLTDNYLIQLLAQVKQSRQVFIKGLYGGNPLLEPVTAAAVEAAKIAT